MYPKFATPKTLTKAEQRRLLRAVRAHGSPRDRALLSLALSTGLRLRELAGLNVGDVSVGKAGTAWRIQFVFREWQAAARFESVYPFHALRHSAITNVYRATRDLYLTQRFARHSSPLTTTIYTHPSDEELYAALRGIKT
ncbi:MAG: hypothetical protein E6K76_11610 [Candidatus Eisenbacteria bacterium]|uniref:Tyr recombinase domain-containing protein n=1 Tax=Eiseniibacteriota bacterium TaxID=2212470 RepID=A0A538T0C3_UNCEI|nr:MAG: hypothetical protein E6K76_11610 [Candidatus Eisenbacteria bacterium]